MTGFHFPTVGFHFPVAGRHFIRASAQVIAVLFHFNPRLANSRILPMLGA
jgi:hypothetical protein